MLCMGPARPTPCQHTGRDGKFRSHLIRLDTCSPKALTGYQLFTLGVRTEGFQMAEPADTEGRHMGKEKPV